MERLKKKQATLRQAIDKIIAVASDPLQSPTIQVGELEEHLDLLLEQSDELKSVNENIEKKIDLQELDSELKPCAAYTEKICSLKTKLKRALRSQTANEQVNNSVSDRQHFRSGSTAHWFRPRRGIPATISNNQIIEVGNHKIQRRSALVAEILEPIRINYSQEQHPACIAKFQ
ncbi:hypothetical protein HPB49_008139 [Dermacentor silvarum]|uniref:Uncharacterized protein n=1 Tax=Dermacentor silvarum TaxID=543639 RepID=A0ACB8D3E8_DERSI|nr:hypothetical protein HPB49_008139 [Dermacentor silvarum]